MRESQLEKQELAPCQEGGQEGLGGTKAVAAGTSAVSLKPTRKLG